MKIFDIPGQGRGEFLNYIPRWQSGGEVGAAQVPLDVDEQRGFGDCADAESDFRYSGHRAGAGGRCGFWCCLYVPNNCSAVIGIAGTTHLP